MFPSHLLRILKQFSQAQHYWVDYNFSLIFYLDLRPVKASQIPTETCSSSICYKHSSLFCFRNRKKNGDRTYANVNNPLLKSHKLQRRIKNKRTPRQLFLLEKRRLFFKREKKNSSDVIFHLNCVKKFRTLCLEQIFPRHEEKGDETMTQV